MSDELPIPKARYEVTIKVKMCDWNDVVRELQRLADHVQEHGELCKLGGGRSYVDIQIDKSVTPESYKAKLLEWCETQKKKNQVTT